MDPELKKKLSDAICKLIDRIIMFDDEEYVVGRDARKEADRLLDDVVKEFEDGENE